jgi:hypothetical protein
MRRFKGVQWDGVCARTYVPESTEFTQGFDVQTEMPFWEGLEASRGEAEESAPGRSAARVRGVVGKERLFLKVHEGSGELNESLIKAPVFIGALEPEVFEDVVRFVELGLVETEKKRAVFPGKEGVLGHFCGG